MPLAVHRRLRQRFGDADRQRRILDPGDRHPIVEPRLAGRCEEPTDLIVRLARVRAQVVERGKVVRFRDHRLNGAVAGRPYEIALDGVDVMQAVADRLVVARRGMRGDRLPQLRLPPLLVTVQIPKNGISMRISYSTSTL